MQVVEAHGARIPQIGLGTMTLKTMSVFGPSMRLCIWDTAISTPPLFTPMKKKMAKDCVNRG
jgi:hypothetical protein